MLLALWFDFWDWGKTRGGVEYIPSQAEIERYKENVKALQNLKNRKKITKKAVKAAKALEENIPIDVELIKQINHNKESFDYSIVERELKKILLYIERLEIRLFNLRREQEDDAIIALLLSV